MYDLNSCPKCNGEAEIIGHYIKGVSNRYHYFIRCKECRYRKYNEYKKREKAIENWNNQTEWHDASNYPEENKWIIILDKNNKEHNDHTWNGHCYYDWIRRDDGDCDGYPTDVEVIKWKYE